MKNDQQRTLSYYYHFDRYSNDLLPFVIREFLDNGVDKLVFSDTMIRRALQDAEYLEMLRNLTRKMQVQFISMHAPFGPADDLNNPEPEQRQEMLKRHIRAMAIAAEFGSRTYTIHVGAYHFCHQNTDLDLLRKLALESLETLVPAAEKNGIILAVENSFERPNAAREIVPMMKHFGDHPWLGVCYDTGHANIMASAPWKKLEAYPEWMHSNWHNQFEFEDDAIETLHPYIVTTHIHDNSGYTDHHGMPGDGTIDWKSLVPKLRSCPRMLEYQTEVTMFDGTNWAGQLLAPAGGYSIRKLVETFRNLGF